MAKTMCEYNWKHLDAVLWKLKIDKLQQEMFLYDIIKYCIMTILNEWIYPWKILLLTQSVTTIKYLVFTYHKFKIVIKVDPVVFVSGSFFTICVINFRLKFWTHQWSLKMNYIWFNVLYKYDSLASIQIYCSYLPKAEERGALQLTTFGLH